MSRAEVAVWSALTLVLLLGWLKWVRPTDFNDYDTFQYLSEARHIAAGDGWQTSLVHWDAERKHGTIPAPATHFPPGYPLALAAFETLGLVGHTAGVACSIIAAVLLIPLILVAAEGLGLSARVARAVLFLAVSNSVVMQYGTAILSEALFALLTLASATALILGEEPALRGKNADGRWLAVSGLLAGIGFWVRYAGIFLVAAIGLYHLVRLFTSRFGRRARVMAVLVSGAVMVPILIRNTIYSGSWTGGAERRLTYPLNFAVRGLVNSVFHTITGDKRAEWGPGEVLIMTGILALAAAVVLAYRNWRAIGTTAMRPGLSILWLYPAVYTAGSFYLSLHSEVGLQPRKFYPLIAMVALLAGSIYRALAREVQSRGLQCLLALGGIVTLAGYGVANAENLWHPPVQPPVPVAERLAEEIQPRVTAGRWIEEHIPKDAPIVASCGQGLGYMLDRKTVSVVSPQFTAVPWDERNTRAIMARFHADWLILFPDDPCEDTSGWPYLRPLAAGTPAVGFRLATRSKGIIMWRREP
jgi:Dolichyl-phosphate-mannose-protein mannosyltransferase